MASRHSLETESTKPSKWRDAEDEEKETDRDNSQISGLSNSRDGGMLFRNGKCCGRSTLGTPEEHQEPPSTWAEFGGASHRSCQQKSEIKMNEVKTENLNLSTWNPEWLSGKESACNAGDVGSIDPWVRKIPWRRKWQPTTVLLPGKPHGHSSLAGCSP